MKKFFWSTMDFFMAMSLGVIIMNVIMRLFFDFHSGDEIKLGECTAMFLFLISMFLGNAFVFFIDNVNISLSWRKKSE